MPFDEQNHPARNATHIGAPNNVCVSVNRSDKGRAAGMTRSIAFRIGEDLLTQLRWKIGDRVRWAEGYGSEEMCVRFRPDPNGDYTLGKNTLGGSAMIRVGDVVLRHHKFLVDEALMTEVRFIAFAGDLTLELPAASFAPIVPWQPAPSTPVQAALELQDAGE